MTRTLKYPTSFPGLGEALIFFCFFSSIKGRKEDKKERIKEDNEERESKKKYPLTDYDKENNRGH